MAKYADYLFYQTVYRGDMSDADFAKYGEIATMYIDNITNGAASSAPSTMAKALQFATCEYADFFQSVDRTRKETNNGTISSESNDGFSRSYLTGAGLTAAQMSDRDAIARTFLVFPFNLMYGGRDLV